MKNVAYGRASHSPKTTEVFSRTGIFDILSYVVCENYNLYHIIIIIGQGIIEDNLFPLNYLTMLGLCELDNKCQKRIFWLKHDEIVKHTHPRTTDHRLQFLLKETNSWLLISSQVQYLKTHTVFMHGGIILPPSGEQEQEKATNFALALDKTFVFSKQT